MKDEVAYTKLTEAAGPCIAPSAAQTMFHIHFEPIAGVAAALNAPVTSLTHITSLTPRGADGVLLAELRKHRQAIGEVPGSHGGAFGRSVEGEGYAVVYGWDSVEVGQPSVW